ncbi:DUF2617 family protein [Actinophytocola gossypii]|uniref:DUF2617 family protein n=1 Tax=Actinophytocola gossypii TaxID=2812003 RepID=A0ABT2JBX4_9PSEU|nr:DUF2617 family protein [Actinophytocola gossypii]MCT2584965.1 DUF2617 family protein [Actinophytocola gossypii]
MRARLSTRFADSRAADLSLAYGLRPLPALGTHRVSLPGIDLELRVLGASHQVVVGDWSETVACLPDRTGALPEREEVVAGGLRTTFEARCHRLDPDALAARVADIVRDCEADPHALVGEFPGSPLAVTALRAWPTATGAAWRTWHAYPQAGELVETLSEVAPV